MERRLFAFIVALAAISTISAPAEVRAQSGIQITPDGKRVLVSKDVGTERWALTRNLSDGAVTGNVFTTGGGDPQFVACSESGRSGENLSMRCEGADRCLLTPCTRDEWIFIADVTLPASFFEPDVAGASSVATRLPAPRSLEGVAGSPNQPAGVQNVPDGGAALVNKDVGGGQRWAITLNADDNTVTGNVFFPDGDDPAFVWCEKKGFDGEELLLSCFGADRCGASGCSEADWVPLFDVPIAEDFFSAPNQIALATLDDALDASLGSVTAFDALILAFGKGYSFRQVAEAGLAGRIQPPGDLVDRSGKILPPEEPAYGATPADTTGFESTAGRLIRVTPGKARERFEGSGVNAESFARMLLFLINRGYTPRQILEAIEEDRFAFDADNARTPFDGYVIIDEKGRPITPLPVGDLDVFLPPDVGSFECGNGVVDPGESCEAGVDITQSCQDFGFDGGPLTCVANICRYQTRDCRRCGNGRREPGEACDGGDVRRQTCGDLGFDSPLVPACSADCQIDDSPCRATVEDGCPDGDLDPGEECDGTRFRDGKTCKDVGFGDSASIICNLLSCTYDTSLCDKSPTPTGCGDGTLGDDEQCDGSSLRTSQCAEFDGRYVSGSLGCNEGSCTYDTSACEEEPVEPEGFCGDGQLDPGEQCDESELRLSDCPAVDSRFDGGTLGCNPGDCTYDTSNCRGCGDGILEDDENCEAGQLSGFTCEILDFGPGTLRCNQNCDFDTSGCGDPSELCGNGIVNPGEECDSRILPGLTCDTIDDRFAGGTLFCTEDCRFDTSECEEANVCREATCPDGTCTPFGADCCGNGFFCAPGTVCVGQGCCPPELTQPCGTKCIRPEALCCGGNACIPGSKCCNGGCIPANAQCCALGGACEAGSVCTNIAGVCCPVDAPKPCVSDMTCRPANVPCP